MNDETIKQLNTTGVPTEHAVIPVPFTVMQAISNYLMTKPFSEVNQFIQILAQIKSVDKRKIPTEE